MKKTFQISSVDAQGTSSLSLNSTGAYHYDKGVRYPKSTNFIPQTLCIFDPINPDKILASTDKFLTPDALIPESFLPQYVKAFNDIQPIKEINLEVKYDSYSTKENGELTGNYVLETTINNHVIISSVKTSFTKEEVVSHMKAYVSSGLGLSAYIKENL